MAFGSVAWQRVLLGAYAKPTAGSGRIACGTYEGTVLMMLDLSAGFQQVSSNFTALSVTG